MEKRRLVEFSPRAVREIERARQWWLENREKAPHAVDEELADLVDRLEAAAEHVGARVRNMPGVRRVLLRRDRTRADGVRLRRLVGACPQCACGSVDPCVGGLRSAVQRQRLINLSS